MASDFSSSSSLVRELGALDERFAAANRTELLEAEEYPHGVMSAFAQHLCRIYEQANGDSIGVLNDTLSVLEKWLGPGDPVIQNIIEVSFAETIFYKSEPLFNWIVDHAGRLLRYECLAFRAREIGYRIINAAKETGVVTAHTTPQALLESQALQERFRALQVPTLDNRPLDPWGQPFALQVRTGPQSDKPVLCVISLASLRGYGRDEDVIGWV
jgi:hypothetical protein